VQDARMSKAKRSAGQTQISISLEEDLVAAIDSCAEREHRTRSNLIVHVIMDYLERTSDLKPKTIYPMNPDEGLQAAEEPSKKKKTG
jgi:predicted transcriptional regulator